MSNSNDLTVEIDRAGDEPSDVLSDLVSGPRTLLDAKSGDAVDVAGLPIDSTPTVVLRSALGAAATVDAILATLDVAAVAAAPITELTASDVIDQRSGRGRRRLMSRSRPASGRVVDDAADDEPTMARPTMARTAGSAPGARQTGADRSGSPPGPGPARGRRPGAGDLGSRVRRDGARRRSRGRPRRRRGGVRRPVRRPGERHQSGVRVRLRRPARAVSPVVVAEPGVRAPVPVRRHRRVPAGAPGRRVA